MYLAKSLLKKERKELGFTLMEMSKKVKLHYSYLCDVENNRRTIGIKNILKISCFFGRPHRDLFYKK